MRPYAPDDAAAVKDAVDTSLEHLRAFMDWAWAAPEPLAVVRKRLRMFRDAFRHGDDWIYGLFEPDGSELVGGAGLHRRVGPEALEIGYWIRASRVRRGLATEAAAALTRIAFERCGPLRVEIHVDPANAASLAVANISLELVEAVAPGIEAGRLITSGYLAADRPTLPGFTHVRRVEGHGWAADAFRRDR